MTYRTTIGITVFGEPAGYSASALISEFQSFITVNTQFNIVVVTQSIQAPLSDAEFYTWDNGQHYFPTPSTLSDANIQKLPQDVQCNMILYDWKNKPPSFGGGTWGGDYGINGVPFIAIPLGAWPWVDNSPGGPWARALSQTLVHEWMHGIDWILELLGYPALPSSDTCGDYGFTGTNDPGWANCLKYFLSLITTDAYIALENWHKLALISPTSTFILTNTTMYFVAKDQYDNQLFAGVVWTKTFGVGSIDTTGLYSAGATAGTATITATYSGITKTASITVIGSLNTITISPLTASLNSGAQQQLNVVCKDADNTEITCPQLIWYTSNSSVATVDASGLVTAGSIPGTANISCTGGGRHSTVSSVITVIGPLDTITISPLTASLNAETTQPLTATCKDAGNNIITCPTLIWYTSNPSVATVNSGLVTAGTTPGTANITCTGGGKNSTSPSVITVLPPTGILSIITTPVNGGILVGGISKGIGTWAGTINSGSHAVSFGIVSGYTTPSEQTVTVNTGQVTHVTGTYILITGSVRFRTNPGTAEIWSGTTLLGTTDSSGILLVPDLAIDTISYLVKKTGYNDSPTQTITVVRDSIVDTSLIILSPAITTGSVRFHTNPDTTEIWSGTTLLGTTDSSGILLVPNLSIDDLDFIIKKTGYNDSPTQTITVVRDSIVDTSLITLSPIVAQAGFGGVGMIMVTGLIVGAMYNTTKKNHVQYHKKE